MHDLFRTRIGSSSLSVILLSPLIDYSKNNLCLSRSLRAPLLFPAQPSGQLTTLSLICRVSICVHVISCTALHSTVQHCTTLQDNIKHCTALHSTALPFTVSSSTAQHSKSQQFRHCRSLHTKISATQYTALQHNPNGTVIYCTIYHIAEHITLLHRPAEHVSKL